MSESTDPAKPKKSDSFIDVIGKSMIGLILGFFVIILGSVAFWIGYRIVENLR